MRSAILRGLKPAAVTLGTLAVCYLVSHLVNPSLPLYPTGGVLFFLASLVVMIGIFGALRKREVK